MVIKLQNISHSFTGSQNEHIPALKKINLEIKEKEKVVLLGTNGSGKSTLLKILNGLIYPEDGKYFYKSRELNRAALKDREFNKIFRKEVVFLFQHPDTMIFNPTVYDEIAFGLRQLKVNDVDEKVRHWSEKFSIAKYLNTPPFRLSGGEKQKVCLAALLCLEPEVLLLDEPSANLDPRTTGWLIDFLQELPLTIITATHNLHLARDLGEKTLVLSEHHEMFYQGDLKAFLDNKEKLIAANLLHVNRH